MIEEIQLLVVIASLGASVAALITAFLAKRQYNHAIDSYEVDLSLRLTERFHKDPQMRKIIKAIAYDEPILKDNNGVAEEDDLISYLMIFTDLLRFLDMKVLTLDTVDELFGIHILDLEKNKEIQNYIKEVQKEQGPDVWSSINTLIDDIKEMNS